ncbi:MAG: hypothetical protein C1O27_001125 [Chloroflexi bacterium]|jgi:hypothetical protein|nr:MAG: hypothetical protein C1O27_001125 [Chloroflexota bacterium]
MSSIITLRKALFLLAAFCLAIVAAMTPSITNAAAPTFACGDTITADVTLTADVVCPAFNAGPAPNHGRAAIIGADNIVIEYRSTRM